MRLFNFKNVSPMDGIGDFIEQWRQPTPYRWQILGVAVALTFVMMLLFIPKTERAPPEKMQITYISSLPAGRTDEEIIASNLANQKRKEARAAEEKRREELRKDFYRKLARASGLDPDKLEREFSEQAASEQVAPAEAEAKANAPAGSAAASGRPPE